MRAIKYTILFAAAIGLYIAGNSLPEQDEFVHRFVDQLTVSFSHASSVGKSSGM